MIIPLKFLKGVVERRKLGFRNSSHKAWGGAFSACVLPGQRLETVKSRTVPFNREKQSFPYETSTLSGCFWTGAHVPVVYLLSWTSTLGQGDPIRLPDSALFSCQEVHELLAFLSLLGAIGDTLSSHPWLLPRVNHHIGREQASPTSGILFALCVSEADVSWLAATRGCPAPAPEPLSACWCSAGLGSKRSWEEEP